jgi:hypothetical protein
VPLIFAATLATGDAERLTGARACPNRSLVGPSGESECKAPSADAGEEVALGKASQIGWVNVDDASTVNFSGCNVSMLNKAFQTVGCEGFYLVVVGGHCYALARSLIASPSPSNRTAATPKTKAPNSLAPI